MAKMASSVVVILGAGIVYWIASSLYRLRINIEKAKRTGLQVVVAPYLPYNRAWQFLQKLWFPLLQFLPRSWWEDWHTVNLPDWPWDVLRQPFDKFGDTFIVAAPTGTQIFTSDAALIAQVTARKDHFPKALNDYKVLAILGLNVVVVEGRLWRFHRKITSASFNEKNAAHTFAEAVRQAQSMTERWMAGRGDQLQRRRGGQTVDHVEHDTMTLALNIIGSVGFGLRLLWPGEPVPEGADAKVTRYGSSEPPKGHSMSFSGALAVLLENIFLLLIVPWPILRNLPFKTTKLAWEAFANYNQYMQEMLHDKIEEVHQDEKEGRTEDAGMDIMGQLVRSKYGRDRQDSAKDTKARATDTPMAMSDDEIISNAFIMLLAGHETTANTLHFTLLELANNPTSQRRLQRDIDSLLGPDSDPSTWVYEEVINAMMTNMLGACMNETLRMMPPVVMVPKMVSPAQDQTAVIDGRTADLPAGTFVSLITVGAQRNPRYWPARPSKVTQGADSDLDDWVPERWFRSSDELLGAGTSVAADADDLSDLDEISSGVHDSKSASFFRPPRGAFIPFSEGPRSCLGRRIAQVEVVAVLAAVFQRYSVELDVGDWAVDDELDVMADAVKLAIYDKARERCRATMRTANSIITLKLHHGQHVPIRLVPRGRERFVSWVDG